MTICPDCGREILPGDPAINIAGSWHHQSNKCPPPPGKRYEYVVLGTDGLDAGGLAALLNGRAAEGWRVIGPMPLRWVTHDSCPTVRTSSSTGIILERRVS